jgi:hypothetical protein
MQARMWHEGKTCSYFEKHATDVPRGFVERCDGQIRWVVFPPQQFQAINKRIGYNGPEFLVWKGPGALSGSCQGSSRKPCWDD